MKILHLTALDGSEWHIPASLVVASIRQQLGPAMGEPDDDELLDWAKNNMGWSDVKDHALMVKAMDPEDMADSWENGKMRVIERAAAPAAGNADQHAPSAALLGLMDTALAAQPSPSMLAEQGGAVVEHYRCRRCALEHRTDQPPPKCDRGPCPMDLVSITVTAPRVEVTAPRTEISMVPPALVTPDDIARAAALLGIDTAALEPEVQSFAGIVLTPEQIDAMALTVKVGEVMTRQDYIDLYYAMRHEAASILAGVEPGDHGDAIIAAFGERAARMAIYKASGLYAGVPDPVSAE